MTVSLDELGKIAFKAFWGSSEVDATDKQWDKATAKRKTAWIAAAVAVAKTPYSELNHLQAYRPLAIQSCARCGQDHTINFVQLRGEPIIESDGTIYSFWGLCPNTGDPVLMRKMLPTPPANKVSLVYKTLLVRDCVKCGGNHEAKFKTFNGAPIVESDAQVYNVWGLCPNTGDPIFSFVDFDSKG